MRMRVFSAPTIIRTVLGAWRQAVLQAGDATRGRHTFKPTPTALVAALLMDGVR